MKLTIASILLWAVLVVDSRKPPAILVPEITIGMSTADIDGTTRLQGIEPTLKWQSAKRVGETELEVRQWRLSMEMELVRSIALT